MNRLLGIVDEAEEDAPKEEIPFLVGQAVAITEGPFTDFNGTVEEVMADKGKVRVSVSLFGRPTSVELDYLQLKGVLSRRALAYAARATAVATTLSRATCRSHDVGDHSDAKAPVGVRPPCIARQYA